MGEEVITMSDFGVSSYRRYQQGDPNALEELVRTYSDPLVRFAYTYVQNSSTAEDIMEDTFATLLVKKREFYDDSHFRAYLYTVARNRAMDYLRRHKREVPLEDVQNVLSSGDLEDSMIHRQVRQTVYVCMQKLPAQYREVLLLSYFDGFSVEEIKGIMGRSSKQVYNLLARARVALRKLLEQEGISHEDL